MHLANRRCRLEFVLAARADATMQDDPCHIRHNLRNFNAVVSVDRLLRDTAQVGLAMTAMFIYIG